MLAWLTVCCWSLIYRWINASILFVLTVFPLLIAVIGSRVKIHFECVTLAWNEFENVETRIHVHFMTFSSSGQIREGNPIYELLNRYCSTCYKPTSHEKQWKFAIFQQKYPPILHAQLRIDCAQKLSGFMWIFVKKSQS